MAAARPDKEVITPEGYKLAPFLLRFAAMMIDAALATGLIVLLYFVGFKPLCNSVGINAATDQLINYRLDGGLMSEDASGQVHDISSSTYEPYQEAVEQFYLVYNATGSTKCPEPLNYDIPKYNTKILGLPEPGLTADSCFEYQKDGDGNNDYTKLGVIKSYYFVDRDRTKGLSDEGKTAMLTFYQSAYNTAYTAMTDSSYYQAVMGPMQWKTKLLLSAISYPSLIVVYAVMPFIFSHGATLGKKLMKLSVITTDGYDLPWWRKLIRVIPLLVCTAIFLFVDDLFVAFPVVGAFLLISVGFGLFTKRRQAIHDILVLSAVVREDDYKAVSTTEKVENA